MLSLLFERTLPYTHVCWVASTFGRIFANLYFPNFALDIYLYVLASILFVLPAIDPVINKQVTGRSGRLHGNS
jgi:hypothetical protein